MKSYAFCLLCLGTAASLPAATWVVDNDESRPANFRSAQAAHDAAAAGDTLLFVGSGVSYGSLDSSKPLHLVGPGFNFLQNGIPFANGGEVEFNFIRLKSLDTPGGGASGSTLKGLRGNLLYADGVSGVVMDQCRITGIELFPAGVQPDLYYVRGFTVRRSFFIGLTSTGGEAVIHNCYGSTITAKPSLNKGASIALFQTNLIGSPDNTVSASLPSTISLSNCIVHNRVQVSNAVAVAGSVLFQNAADFPGNRAATDFAQVYRVAVTDAGRDAHFRLNTDPTNPAIGAGVGGGDAGMFAGAQPYQLSGIPARPRVTHLSTSGVVSDTVGLSVQAGGEVRP